MSFFSSVIGNSTLAGLAGLRWSLPLILIFLFVGQFDYNFIESILDKLIILFLIHFSFQIVQSILYASFGVSSFLGVEARAGGMFYSPNGGGLFSCLIYYFISNYKSKSKKIPLFKMLCILSVIITASATSMMILIALITINYSYKFNMQKILILIAPIIILVAFLNIQSISGRGPGLIEGSLGVRSVHLFSAIEQLSLISKDFGSATSSAFMLRDMGYNIKTIAADSNITSVIINLGIWGFLVLLFIYFYPIYFAIINNEPKILSLSLLFVMSSLTMMVFEIFPINLLLSVAFSAIISEYYSVNHSTYNQKYFRSMTLKS